MGNQPQILRPWVETSDTSPDGMRASCVAGTDQWLRRTSALHAIVTRLWPTFLRRLVPSYRSLFRLVGRVFVRAPG